MKKLAFIICITLNLSIVSSAQTVKSPIWSTATNGDTGWNSPTIGPDGTIYQGDISGTLRAINPDGSLKWSNQFSTNLSGGSASITRDGSKLYIPESSSPGKIFCINTADGSVIWSYVLTVPSHLTSTPEPGQLIGGGINSTPAISYDQNTIYFGTGNWLECNPCSEDIFDDRLIALDVSGASPSLKWEFKSTLEDSQQNESRVSFWAAPSIASDGTIYVGNFNGYLYHIKDDGASFQVLHKIDFLGGNPLPTTPMTGGIPGEEAEVWSACAIDEDGTVFTQSNNGFGWALNPDLTVKWWFPFIKNDTLYDNFIAPALTPNGLVIMAAENGYIYGIDKDTGTETWKWPNTPTPAEEWWRFVSIDQDGICILGSEKSGKYFAIDSNTGLQAWETTEIGLETGSCPAIAADGTIYVTGGYDGDLYAFEGTAPLANTAWPKGMQNNGNMCRRDTSAALGIQENTTIPQELEMFPNPVSKGQKLTLNNVELNGLVEISILNVIGKECYKVTAFVNSNNQLQFSIGKDLTDGFYFLNVGGKTGQIYIQ